VVDVAEEGSGVRGSIRHLGTLSPGVQQTLEGAWSAAEDTIIQVQNDLTTAQELRVDPAVITGLKAELDGLHDQLLVLHADLASMVDEGQSDWNGRLAQLQGGLHALWSRVSLASKRGQANLEFRGLYWGFGVAAVGLALGYAVWRKRKK